MTKNKSNKGFTLIELMISVAIISILLALTMPSFSGFIKDNTIMNSAKVFYSDLNYAKSEAMKGRGTVMIKPTTSTDYGKGWQVFVDVNKNGSYDSGDILLRQQDPLESKQVVNYAGTISFNSYGESLAVSPITVGFCDNRTGNNTGKSIVISLFGLIKIADKIC